MFREYRNVYLTTTSAIFAAIVDDTNPEKVMTYLIEDIYRYIPDVSEDTISGILSLCTSIADEIYNENESLEESFKEIEFIIDTLIHEIFCDEPEYQIYKQLEECFYGE